MSVASSVINSPDLQTSALNSPAKSLDQIGEDNESGDEESKHGTPRDQIFGDFNDEVKKYRALKKQMKLMQQEE